MLPELRGRGEGERCTCTGCRVSLRAPRARCRSRAELRVAGHGRTPAAGARPPAAATTGTAMRPRAPRPQLRVLTCPAMPPPAHPAASSPPLTWREDRVHEQCLHVKSPRTFWESSSGEDEGKGRVWGSWVHGDGRPQGRPSVRTGACGGLKSAGAILVSRRRPRPSARFRRRNGVGAGSPVGQ